MSEFACDGVFSLLVPHKGNFDLFLSTGLESW